VKVQYFVTILFLVTLQGSVSVQFSSVHIAKINVVLSAKHFRTMTQQLVLLTPLSLEKKCLQESPE